MPPPPTPAVRNQFIAPVGGDRSHIHPDNDGFSHQEPECAPPPLNTTSPGHAHGGLAALEVPSRRVAGVLAS